MTSHALPADVARWWAPTVPVLIIAGTAVVLVGLLAALLPADEIPLLPVHLTALALAASAAYLVDDSSREVTEVVPHSLLRRRLVVALPGGAVIAATWAAVALLLDARSAPLPLAALTWQTAGLGCVVLAASAVVALRGEAEPGNLVASTSMVVQMGVLVVQPVRDHTLLVEAPDASARAGWWVAVIVVAALSFVVASAPLSRRPRWRGVPSPR
jgi:hypothetical protein